MSALIFRAARAPPRRMRRPRLSPLAGAAPPRGPLATPGDTPSRYPLATTHDDHHHRSDSVTTIQTVATPLAPDAHADTRAVLLNQVSWGDLRRRRHRPGHPGDREPRRRRGGPGLGGHQRRRQSLRLHRLDGRRHLVRGLGHRRLAGRRPDRGPALGQAPAGRRRPARSRVLGGDDAGRALPADLGRQRPGRRHAEHGLGGARRRGQPRGRHRADGGPGGGAVAGEDLEPAGRHRAEGPPADRRPGPAGGPRRGGGGDQGAVHG